MMPPQTDKLSILRAVLAQLAERGAISTDAFGQTALRGQSAPNMSNQFGQAALSGFNSPSRVAKPSGFDATMRDVRIPPTLLSQTDPYYRSVQANTVSGNDYQPKVGDVDNTGYVYTQDDVDEGTRYMPDALFGRTALEGGSARNPMPPRVQNPDVTGFDGALRGEGVSDRARTVQSSGKPSPKASTQASGKPTPSGSQTASQQGKPSESGKSAPVGKAEPSGEALSYFRKNKQSGGWNALGTGVSLVQQSMKPEKGGLKSRTEYDRLLRGSDNFKKLDGNEQQRVRQAFAQWMNEQNIFKGKA